MTTPPPDLPPRDNAYDRVPYGSQTVSLTQPDHLALCSLLAGGPLPPREGFRLLEVGCAEGGNLVPLAVHHPESRFVGIDSSATEIALGRVAQAELCVENLELKVADLRDPTALDGRFHFIIAHGVYSWIPDEARAALLGLLRDRLTDDGVAYVSWNAMPGWAVRGVAREVALRAAAASPAAAADDDPEARAERVWASARGLRALATDDAPWRRLLGTELDRLVESKLGYLTHEYLSPHNRAFYLGEVVAAASAAGLAYLGDVMNLRHESAQARRVYEELAAAGLDGVELEEAADVIICRAFRISLLCRSGAEGPPPGDERLEPLLQVAASLREPQGAPDLRSGIVERFGGVGGVELDVADPLVKAALRELSAVYPDALAISELGRRAVRRLEAAGFVVELEGTGFASLVADLRLLHRRGQAELRLRPRALRVAPGTRPRATRLARLEARAGDAVTTPLHDRLGLDALAQAMVPLLDGTRDAAALLAELLPRALGGEFPELPVARGEAAVLARLLVKLNETVDRLSGWGLLEPAPPDGQR